MCTDIYDLTNEPVSILIRNNTASTHTKFCIDLDTVIMDDYWVEDTETFDVEIHGVDPPVPYDADGAVLVSIKDDDMKKSCRYRYECGDSHYSGCGGGRCDSQRSCDAY